MPAKKNVMKTTIELTPKQRTFVYILFDNWVQISKVEAAQRSGYSSKKA